MNLYDVQTEHAAWLAEEYPGQPASLPASGILEEAGELLSAMVKLEQERRWGQDLRFVGKDWRAELMDAIGDCAIYCCSLCNVMEWSFGAVCDEADQPSVNERTLRDLVLALVRAAAEVAAWPECRMYTVVVLSLLKAISWAMNIQFSEAVLSVWAKVKTRRRGSTRDAAQMGS